MSQENVENIQTLGGIRYRVTPASRANQRRPLDEHFYARFPAAYRLLADRLSRLPPRSRVRRSLVGLRERRATAAYNRRDFEAVALGWAPGVEYRPAPNLIIPDEGTVAHGHDGYLRRIRTWLDAFDDLRFDPEEVIDFGDKVLVTVRWTGHGSGSGVPMSGQLFQLYTLRLGLV